MFAMSEDSFNTKKFYPKALVAKEAAAPYYALKPAVSALVSGGKRFTWSSGMDRVRLIREGIPYAAIETIGQKMNTPVKDVLPIFDLPQTTYNKKRREEALLNSRDSETVLLLSELIDFGKAVFNEEEEKFLRWMKKPNLSLGGVSPESLLDSTTGIQEVKNSLNRLEYGNLA